MTRLSRYLLPTVKEAPADAEAISHRLMVRAGMIRQVGSGLWSYLPAGWRVQRKIEAIIREEIDRIGGQEVLLPLIQPRELWRRTGRDTIDELFKLEDRRGAPLVLAMTHEEAMTFHVAHEVRSYRDLPLILYHFQIKGRDEPRPRAGVLRTREFIMKDAYSFDRDDAGLATSYEAHAEAYGRIFDRTGLEWYKVESDVGMMGGSAAHEYMAPCAAGENEIALAPGYAANVEIASAGAQAVAFPPPLDAPVEVVTPGKTTIDDVSTMLGVPPGALIKALPMVNVDDDTLVLVLVRGDHRLNEVKLRNALGEELRPASEPEIVERFRSAVGFTGPIGVAARIVADECLRDGSYVAGSNRPDLHLRGVEAGRDFTAEFRDLRRVEVGDLAFGSRPIEIVPAIEVGNIFKLGTRYSDALGATFLDESGKERPVVMGSYGIGPARIAAAAIEQRADDAGIVWPAAIAPFSVHLVALGKPGSPEHSAAEQLYGQLDQAGVEVLFDDRGTGPGAALADAELVGCPVRVAIGRRSLESGLVELTVRHGLIATDAPLADAVGAVTRLLEGIEAPA